MVYIFITISTPSHSAFREEPFLFITIPENLAAKSFVLFVCTVCPESGPICIDQTGIEHATLD